MRPFQFLADEEDLEETYLLKEINSALAQQAESEALSTNEQDLIPDEKGSATASDQIDSASKSFDLESSNAKDNPSRHTMTRRQTLNPRDRPLETVNKTRMTRTKMMKHWHWNQKSLMLWFNIQTPILQCYHHMNPILPTPTLVLAKTTETHFLML